MKHCLKQKMAYPSSLSKGFTLIEMIVAVTIFVLVAMIITVALLAVIDSSRKANAFRAIIDNVNFAMENITYKMKFGSGYVIGADGLYFYDRNGLGLAYCSDSATKRIYLCSSGNIGVLPSACGNVETGCNPLTSGQIQITSMSFKKTDPTTSSCVMSGVDCSVPSYVIMVKGEATVKNKTTKLDFQTTVTKNSSR